MKRRDILRALGATGAGLVFKGCASQPATTNTLTDADVERMLRTMTAFEPAPGQAASVREALVRMRFEGTVDPKIQPSLGFDVEVDVE